MLMSVAHVERGKREGERELLCFCSVQNTKVWDTKEGGDDGQSVLSAGLFIIALSLSLRLTMALMASQPLTFGCHKMDQKSGAAAGGNKANIDFAPHFKEGRGRLNNPSF